MLNKIFNKIYNKMEFFLNIVETYRKFKKILISRSVINMYSMLTINMMEIVEEEENERIAQKESVHLI